ncbi:GFA family protein [Cereibacter sphaeroides]|uniref:GFA family protein n=1 Tax=Cereibacter sphaeroides TaxID=1063 RepID=UPI002D7EB756|nr:GFA family protein [Cereibacter sphaeroides]
MRGSCLCGQVAFEVEPPLRPVIACHCTQCRRWSGHYWSASSVPLDRFRLLREEGLRWYRASDTASRGFCAGCGASLFWKPDDEARISFSPAAIDGPTGLATAEHIFTAEAGDYYAPEGPPPPRAEAPSRLAAACLCGATRFTVPGPAGEVVACHCEQCRKTSGQFHAAFEVPPADLVYQSRDRLAEHRAANGAVRGFCAACGSSLWFRGVAGDLWIESGAVEGPTGGRLARHLHVAEKVDWYPLDDGLPQRPGE